MIGSKSITTSTLTLLSLYLGAPSGLAEAADPCREETRNVTSVNQQYRAAVRDVASSCTKESGDCEGAKSTVDDALTQLLDAHEILLNVCVGSTPPPPPAEPPTVPGDIIITEFMANPSSVADSDGEWFEIYNPTSTDFDLNGLVVQDDGVDVFVINTPLIISAGGFVVLGNNGDPAANGGVVVDFEYPSAAFTLSNAADEIEIFNGTTSLDRITYDATVEGGSRSLDPDHFDASANDDPNNWCDSTTPSLPAGDLGTPGSPNEDCP